MDFVYIVGTGSRWDNNELRYSLRSLDENATVDSVSVVGNTPGFLRNVTAHKMAEKGLDKAERVARKLLAAIEKLPEKFVLMNDDFYLLRRLDKLPSYHHGPLRQTIRKHLVGRSNWHQRKQQALQILQAQGIAEPLDFSLHVPFPVERQKIAELAKMVPFWRKGLFRSLYGNLFRDSLEAVHMGDVKSPTVSGGNRGFYSSTGVVRSPVRQFLAKRFPNPSRFERAS
jgi:hypothetical protein